MKTLAANRTHLVAALAGLNLLLAIGGWMLLVAPQSDHASNAAQQLAQTRSDLARLGSLPGHQKQSLIRTAQLYRLAQAMPAAENEPDLMLGLDQLAQASGITVLGISPLTPTAAAVGGYTELPITLNVSGSYGALTRYLERLRALVSVHRGTLHVAGPLLSVTSVGLTPASAGKAETATISLNAFFFGTLQGATLPPSATTTTGTTPTTTTSGG